MSAARCTALLLLAASLGCAQLAAVPTALPGSTAMQLDSLVPTQVELSGANYRIVASNVTGESQGLTILLFLTVSPPSYAKAFADLEAKAPAAADRSLAFANLGHQISARNFVLFSLPKITVRADVVEFDAALAPSSSHQRAPGREAVKRP